MSNLLGANTQATHAPNATGIALLTSDSKLRTIGTDLPIMTTMNETLDRHGIVTDSRITLHMQPQTTFSFPLFDGVTGTMRLASAPTANGTPTVDDTNMSITPNGDVGVGTTTP